MSPSLPPKVQFDSSKTAGGGESFQMKPLFLLFLSYVLVSRRLSKDVPGLNACTIFISSRCLHLLQKCMSSSITLMSSSPATRFFGHLNKHRVAR